MRLSRLGSSGGATEDVPRFAESHDLEVSVDGERVQVFTLAGEAPPVTGKRQDQYQQDRRDLDANWKVRVPVKAGSAGRRRRVPQEVVGGWTKPCGCRSCGPSRLRRRPRDTSPTSAA